MEILDSLQQLLAGFGVATTLQNLFYCLAGAVVGTLVGILPGPGPIAGIALLIPATFSLNPTSAIIMLAGIYYGAMYGGSTTSILIQALIVKAAQEAAARANQQMKVKAKPAVEELFRKEWPVTTWREVLSR